jgi:hypothetical protein
MINVEKFEIEYIKFTKEDIEKDFYEYYNIMEGLSN